MTYQQFEAIACGYSRMDTILEYKRQEDVPLQKFLLHIDRFNFLRTSRIPLTLADSRSSRCLQGQGQQIGRAQASTIEF
jgi:hypothetical protein